MVDAPDSASGARLLRHLCDAISFVLITTLLEHMPCFAFDEDFRRLGLTVLTTAH
jgi:hypothetical protein